MDVAYDHVQEEALAPSEEHQQPDTSTPANQNLNNDLQQAFQAVSASPWGAKLGGWFSQARKQGETLVADLQKEAQDASSQATQGWSTLREQVTQRTQGISLAEAGPEVQVPGEEAVPTIRTTSATQDPAEAADRPESLPADIVKEAGSLVATLRSTAASKLKDLQQAEDAADEALLKFGSNVRNFLRDAVTITAPTDADSSKPRGTDGVGNEVLFETSEPGTGKKVFHTTRLDAQLHAIHTTATSFTEDPQGPQWDSWKDGEFDIEKQTEAIAHDLEKYEELRRAMEKLVPEKVEYKVFWMRYYFLRKAIEEEEKRRREVLKGAATDPSEEVAWDDDEDEVEPEAEHSSTPQPPTSSADTVKPSNDSTTTLNVTTAAVASNDHLKPRRSHEDDKSVAGSDASYDIVSGTTSRAAGSPKEEKKDPTKDESDDDWE